MGRAAIGGLALFSHASHLATRRTRQAPDAAARAVSRIANFAVANAQTFAMYGGIGLLGFFVTIYLQQVAGYSALKSGA